ncbi:MAG: fibronectin type III domain-containing protein [Verrucomicrobiota bacterium]
MKKLGRYFGALSAFLVVLPLPTAALLSRDYAIEVRATVKDSPPQISLNWRATPDGLQTLVNRKTKEQTSWTLLAVLSPSTTNFVDTSVSIGSAYEYGLTKSPMPPSPISGYIYAGIKAPLVDSRGKLVLIVDTTYASNLQTELATLQQDLTGDGWVVLRYDVSRSSTPAQVKLIIVSAYNSDPASVKSVFLLGHVAVPYSGNYNADDHPDHTGAWVADTFYGDVNGSWSDSTVNNTSATRLANRNIPGDGKFDQSQIPTDVELEVGRVDLSNMPAFLPKTELDLLRQYLNKDHNFRHGITVTQPRALLFDGFGPSGGEAYAASGWRNFAPFYSTPSTEIGSNSFFSTLGAQSYLWSYVAGGGDANYKDCYSVGSTANFATTDTRTVFLMVFGSYFGDWDMTNDFFRAPLCSTTYSLATMWAGRPHWFLHHMALGGTLGFSTRLTQNNSSLYKPADFSREVHISLAGDPSLRMHVVKPVSNLQGSANNGNVLLRWSPSTDTNLSGYHVYRSSKAGGPFIRLTPNSITQTNFTDVISNGGSFTYQVRAVKLETSASGSYTNASQGIFLAATIPPATPVNLSNSRFSNGKFIVSCSGAIGQKFALDSSLDFFTWTPLQTNVLAIPTLNFTNSAPATASFYRTRLVP